MPRANFTNTDEYTETYAAKMADVPDLSPEDEREMILRWRELGDTAARDRVVSATMKVAVAVARQHRTFGLPMCDLIGLGADGILKALSMYDLSRKDVRFASYAWHWIRAKITRAECRHWHMVSGEATSSRRLFSLLKALARGQAIHGGDREAVYAYVAAQIKFPIETVREWVSLVSQKMISLDSSMIHPDSNDECMKDRLVYKSDVPVDEQVEIIELQRMVRHKIDQILPQLSPRQINILNRRLLCDVPESLEVMAREEGISRERVRQVECVIKDRLRKLLRDEAEELGIDTDAMLEQMFESAAA